MNRPHFHLYKDMMRKLFILIVLALSTSAYAIPDEKEGALDAVDIGGDTFVKSSSLASFLDGAESVNFLAKSGKTECDGFSLEYSLFSQFVKSGDDIYNIYRPVEYRDGSFLLPIQYMVSVLNKVSNHEFAWNGRTLRVSRPEFNVTGMSASQKINGLMIEIYMKENLKFDAMKADDYWLAITISGGKIDSMAFQKPISAKAIYDIKTYQFDKSCQISIRLRPRDFAFSSKIKEDPLRIQFLIRGEGFSDSSMLAEEMATETFGENPIDVIVIDPGHGGEDTGAIGPGKTKEKDIVLKIAKRVYDLLSKDGRFKPILTRQDDVFVPLSQRTKLANEVGGDLFVSIHCNAAKNKKATGLMAFSLADAKSDEARAAASLENSSIRFEKVEDQKQYTTDLDFTLRDMMQAEFQRESVDFADMLQKGVSRAVGVNSRGIDQAGFFVLNKAYMPAVLLETAFISNSTEEKKLKTEEFQRKAAQAIFDTIVAFKGKYEIQKRSNQ